MAPSGSSLQVWLRYLTLRPVLALVLIVQLLLGPGPVVLAADCSTVLETSRTSYFEGRFDKAIEALDDCLRSNSIPLGGRGEAYRLLGLCHVAKDEVTEARTAIHQILLLDPSWEPDPLQDPPAFRDLVTSVRQEMEDGKLVSPEQASKASQSSKKKWWMYGGLAAAGAVLAAVLLSSDGNESEGPDLPEPPALPDN